MAYIPAEFDRRIREQAKFRCGYCLFPQRLAGAKLEIDHLFPEARGGKTVEENLWLSCRECNKHKSQQIYGVDLSTGKRARLFNPRRQKWKRHFKFNQDYTIILGKTLCGRATINALKLNNSYLLTARDAWVEAGWYPPKDF